MEAGRGCHGLTGGKGLVVAMTARGGWQGCASVMLNSESLEVWAWYEDSVA